MTDINWKIDAGDSMIIDKIVNRHMESNPQEDRISLEMDLIACHLNGCPLRLTDLLDADGFNFSHDIFGIMNHMDRKTGKLIDCFIPRFSRKMVQK